MSPQSVEVALPLAAALLLGAAAFALARGVAQAVGAPYERSRTRLGEIVRDAGVAPPSAVRRVRRRGNRSSGIESDLRRAGLAWTTTDYLIVSLLTGGVVGASTFALTGSPLVGAPVGLLACSAPTLVVRRRAAARSGRFNAQVVDAIELVASSLRSGFGFMQSLELAGQEQPAPMSEELVQVIREVDLGMSVEDALERLVQRTHDEDLALVVQAVLIQRRVGGDLGDVLGRIAAMIRDRIRVRGEIRTLTAQARMSAWIIGFLPVGLAGATALLQPSQLAVLFTTPIGQLLVGFAFILQVVGFILVRRVADIAY